MSRVALVVASSSLVASGCGTAGPSRPLEEYAQLREVETGETLAARLFEFAMRFAVVTEAAADEIIARAEDPKAREAALLWKVEGIPVGYFACFRPNPLGGFYDVWTLCAQVRDCFVEGDGKDAFGKYQHIAVKASETLLEEADAMAREVLAEKGNYAERAKEVREIARELPLQSPIMNRVSPLGRLARYGASEQGALATLASLEHQFRTLQRRLDLYAGQLPKHARWQAELLAKQVLEGPTVSGISRSLLSIDEHAGTLARGITALEETLRKEVALVLKTFTAEAKTIVDNISEQRAEALKGLSAEREAALEDVAASIDKTVKNVFAGVDERIDRGFLWGAPIAIVGLVLVALLVWATARSSSRAPRG